MEKSRRLWVLALMLGIGGCAGDETGSPTAGTAGAGGTSTTVKNNYPPAGPAATKGADTKAAPAPSKEESKKTEAPPLEAPKTGASQDDGKPVKLTDDEIAKIKTLPAAEQDLALKQAVCPVSGDHLGNMGAPVKITAEGRTFYLCCKGCQDDVKANPKAVIARLDKK
jgi:YHS domain-containing protein